MKYWQAHTSLPRHTKRFKFEKALGIRTGGLHYLYLWFNLVAEQGKSGDVTHVGPEELARACEWEGEANLFQNALIEAGFMDKKENGKLTCHDWMKENGYYEREKTRIRLAQKKRRSNALQTRFNRVTSALEVEVEVKNKNKQNLEPKTLPSAHHSIIQAHHDSFLKAYNLKPDLKAQDFAAVKAFLARGQTLENLLGVLPKFMADGGKFAGGHSLKHLCDNWQKYLGGKDGQVTNGKNEGRNGNEVGRGTWDEPGIQGLSKTQS